MINFETINPEIPFLLIRLVLGIVLLSQGIDKVFNIKIGGVVEALRFPNYGKNLIPLPLLYISAIYTSYVELIGGLAIIIGAFVPYFLYALGLDMVIAVIGLSYKEKMTDLRHIFPRLIMIFILMMMPAKWDLFSLDHLIFN